MNTNFEVIGLTRLKESNPSPEVDVSRNRRKRCEEMCGERLEGVGKCGGDVGNWVGVWGEVKKNVGRGAGSSVGGDMGSVLGCGWR